MTQFFELSDDVLLAIYKKLPPHELLTIVSVGEKSQKLHRLALNVLFMQQDSRVCQQKMLEYWMNCPAPLLVPSKKHILPALKHLEILHQLMGLSTLNSTVGITKQLLEPYITHLVTQISSPPTTRYNAERLLHIAPLLSPCHIEKIIPQLQNNLFDGMIRSITQATLHKLAHKLTSAQINTLIAWIEKNLTYTNDSMRTAALFALPPLATRLTPEEVVPLISGLQKNLSHQADWILYLSLQALASLSSKLSPKQANLLLPELENKLMHAQENMRITALHAIKTIARKLDRKAIPQLITKIQKNLEYAQGDMCIELVDALKTLVHRDHPEKITPLIDTTLENLKQSQETMRISYLNTVSALAEWFTAMQVSSFLPNLLENLQHPSNPVREAAMQSLNALIHKFNPDQVNQIITLIQVNLKHPNDRMRLTTLRALRILASILFSEQLSLFLSSLQENISLNRNPASLAALNILEEQAHKLMPNQLTLFIPVLKEIMDHKSDQVRLAVEKTLAALISQPQNENIAQEIMAWTMNSMHESKPPENKKWWQLLLTLDENSNHVPSRLGCLPAKDNEYLGKEAINWMRNKKTLGNLSLPPTFLVNLLVQLNDSERALRAKDLLSITCDNNFEEGVRDTALQALSSWSIVLLQEPLKYQDLLSTLVHDLDEEVQKINNPFDKYSMILQMMKIQIPHEPILVSNEIATP